MFEEELWASHYESEKTTTVSEKNGVFTSFTGTQKIQIH